MSWRQVTAERALLEATRIGGCSFGVTATIKAHKWGGQAEAEKIVQQGLESFGLSESDLKSLPGSDPRKVAIAGFNHQSTTTPQAGRRSACR